MTRKGRITVAVVILAIVAAFVSVRGCYRYYYPFGMSHRCDKILWGELREYAERNGGAFPSGQKTPEASLSLIHSLDPSGGVNAYLLCPRGMSCDVVREILQQGQLLGPETCGWNYVEGLHLDSNPNLALFWDKEGLDEMGCRLPEGGHFVSFVGQPCEYVPASRWDSFLEEQRRLLAEEKAKRQNNEQPHGTGEPHEKH
jgi:hypothetical protein